MQTLRSIPFLAGAMTSVCLLMAPVRAADPQVLEEFRFYEDEFGAFVTELEYTVVNPSDSGVGDIVGLAVSLGDNGGDMFAVTENGWAAQNLFGPSDWDEDMFVEEPEGVIIGELPTWREFFGGIDYPFGFDEAVGFFVPFSDIGDGFFLFDDASPAVSQDESLGDFFARNIEFPASEFALAHTSDASNSFEPGDFSTTQGETQIVPEPSTVTLATIGMALAIVAGVRRRRR